MIRGRVLGFLLIAATLLVSPPSSRAQGPPIHTDTPIMLGLEGRGVRSFLKTVRKTRLLSEGSEIEDPINRRATATLVPIIVPYNLATRFQVGVIAPFVRKELGTVSSNATRSGLGDVTLYGKFLVLQRDGRKETFRVAVKGRVKLPTGSEETTLPLGTGSTDLGTNLVAGWVKQRWGLFAEALYTHTTGHNGRKPGELFGFNLAVGYRAIPKVYRTYPAKQLNLYLELNGSTEGRREFEGTVVADSGGSIVYLSPGIQYVGGRRWLVEASWQIPMVDHPNGTQLGTDWTFSLGGRVLIF